MAETQAIDLWYLFPLAATLRCMPNHGKPPAALVEKLKVLLGDPNWEQSFYGPNQQLSLFGGQEDRRTEDWRGTKNYVVRRLKETGFAHVLEEPAVLRSSSGGPLFLLTFAAANKAALNIAKDLTRQLR